MLFTWLPDYPFLETNRSLLFDRKLSYGTHLDIPAGTAVRFEPGESKHVSLVTTGGNRIVQGGSRMSEGVVDVVGKWPEIEERLRVNGFKDQREDEAKVVWEESGEKVVSRETCE